MKVVTPDQVRWGGYKDWEGPWWPGRISYILPPDPDFWDKTLMVLSATEGKMDAVNMLDSCICSASMVQLCDASFFLTTSLFSYIADNIGPTVITGPLSEALRLSNAAFKKYDEGWRFVFLDDRGKVRNSNMQRQLYLGGTGLKSSWTPEGRKLAKTWCAGIANIWNDPRCQELQVRYLKVKLPSFISVSAKRDLFGSDTPKTNWSEAAQAAYMSFSANNPSKAATAYFKHCRETTDEKWSPAWVIGMLRTLTFSPNVAIYPKRYDAIRPVLENLWGVKLPRTSKELMDRSMPTIPDIPSPIISVNPLPEPSPAPIIKFEPKQLDPPGPTGFMGFLWTLIQFILSLFSRK